MRDSLEIMGRSLIHHGTYNDRVYLMKLHEDDGDTIVQRLDTLAVTRGYSKIFAKIPSWAEKRFLDVGYTREARIPGFYSGGYDACFMGKFLTEARARENEPLLVRDVLTAAEAKAGTSNHSELPSEFTVGIATEEHTEDMAKIYQEVFASYPFPIHDAAFLQDAMRGSTMFFAIWNGREIAALSSAEMDFSSSSAEMTDFATHHTYQGKGLALFLLREMENVVKERGIRSLFTIARSYSYSMNITFARGGYRYAGTLVNNTNIFGRLESMNVWYKNL